NLPNTMLESFATGTPVISFAAGGMKEHIENEFNGMLAEEISAVSLARAIESLLANTSLYKPHEIKTYAEKHFSLAKQAEGYMKVYHNLLN
ncbi:MAG: glycosyltransferase, partial [Bacteroidota bacterium]